MPSPPRSSIAAPTWDPARGQLGPLSRPSHGPVGGAHWAGAFAVVALRGNLSFSFMPHSTKQHESWACVSSPRFSSTTTTESMAPTNVDCRYCEDLGSSEKTRSSSSVLLDCGPGCSHLGRSTKGHDSLKLSRTVSRAFDVTARSSVPQTSSRSSKGYGLTFKLNPGHSCGALCTVPRATMLARRRPSNFRCSRPLSQPGLWIRTKQVPLAWAWLPLFQRGHFAI